MVASAKAKAKAKGGKGKKPGGGMVADWAVIRPRLLAELDRQGISRQRAAVAAGYPVSTVYSAFDGKDVKIGLLGALLETAGLSWAWLDSIR